jgi:hypothetical protein
MPSRVAADGVRAEDFPAADMIAKRFAFKLEVMPVPHHDDFRVNLGDDIEAHIRREIESTVGSRQDEAQRELWTRLLKTVRHFATTMAQEGKTFQKTTVTNLTRRRGGRLRQRRTGRRVAAGSE